MNAPELAPPELARILERRARPALLAALTALNEASTRYAVAGLRPEIVHDALTRGVLRFVALLLGMSRGLFAEPESFARARLFECSEPRLHIHVVARGPRLESSFPELLAPARAAFHEELEFGLGKDGLNFAACPVEALGNLYELLLGESVARDDRGAFILGSGKKRKQTGTFYTPRALTEVVVRGALEALALREGGVAREAHELTVCDPSVGGGAFLLEVARALAGSQASPERRRVLVENVLYGVDVNPTAVAVAEAALGLFVADPEFPLALAGKNLRVGDALSGEPRPKLTRGKRSRSLSGGCDFLTEFPEIFTRGGFDLVIGNPPWVAYAGRAAQPLEAKRRAYFAAYFTSLRGYPTLQGLFVERALQLAPRGTVALVVPSPIADLQGYRAVRRAVRTAHAPLEPMLEFGQDAFESVTQPCFALIARARDVNEDASDEPFRLAERQRAGAIALEIAPPAALAKIALFPPFPRELFGEMGFQTTSNVSRRLLLRSETPDARHDYPLLEGRDVREFAEGEPRLFLAPDRELLKQARCRLRERVEYERVRFVIRQTARYPIAALHRGLPFRNSLLAGFAHDELSPELVVGLLNSSLYRALHLSLRRDARQATFPQVKIAHLRALPRPPADDARYGQIAALTTALTHANADGAALASLDDAVFGLFSLEPSAVCEIQAFLRSRGGPLR